MSFPIRTLAAALAVSLAAPAIAGVGAGDTVTTSVRVKRIAVRTPADARAQQRLIADAALQACGVTEHDVAGMRAAIRRSTCYADAMSSARASNTATASATLPDARGRP